MEEKINNGLKLYVKKNPETNQIYGEYIRQANGATTTQQVQEHELDFLEMFCEIDKELSIGHYLEVGKNENMYYARITEQLEPTIQTEQKSIMEVVNKFLFNTYTSLEKSLILGERIHHQTR